MGICNLPPWQAVDKKREPHYLHGTYAPIEIISDYRYLFSTTSRLSDRSLLLPVPSALPWNLLTC